MDYGTLMCWASNSIGRMEEPCVFHVIPAGKPDPVHNCTVRNQTYSTLHVTCGSGFDGGLQQRFVMEVKDAQTHFVVANTTNTRRAAFTVTGTTTATLSRGFTRAQKQRASKKNCFISHSKYLYYIAFVSLH